MPCTATLLTGKEFNYIFGFLIFVCVFWSPYLSRLSSNCFCVSITKFSSFSFPSLFVGFFLFFGKALCYGKFYSMWPAQVQLYSLIFCHLLSVLYPLEVLKYLCTVTPSRLPHTSTLWCSVSSFLCSGYSPCQEQPLCLEEPCSFFKVLFERSNAQSRLSWISQSPDSIFPTNFAFYIWFYSYRCP